MEIIARSSDVEPVITPEGAEHAWFAARPSGTEDKYKIYAESIKSAEHLAQVQSAAKTLVDAALNA